MGSHQSLKREKAKTWKAFSIYIRTRDCIRTTGDPTKGSCITCNKPFDFKNLQAGHAIGGRNNSVLFDEEIVYGQCLTAESNIKMFNGSHKSISKIIVGDELWAFNEQDFGLEKAVVEAVSSFIPDKLYEIEMEDGSKFFATGDHRVVSNGKWIRVDQMLHNVHAHDIMEV